MRPTCGANRSLRNRMRQESPIRQPCKIQRWTCPTVSEKLSKLTERSNSEKVPNIATCVPTTDQRSVRAPHETYRSTNPDSLYECDCVRKSRMPGTDAWSSASGTSTGFGSPKKTFPRVFTLRSLTPPAAGPRPHLNRFEIQAPGPSPSGTWDATHLHPASCCVFDLHSNLPSQRCRDVHQRIQ
jgi:hypothetical protein